MPRKPKAKKSKSTPKPDFKVGRKSPEEMKDLHGPSKWYDQFAGGKPTYWGPSKKAS